MRWALPPLAIWVAALAGAVVVAFSAGWPAAAHGYYAAWLIAASLPLGALPALMVMDLVGGARTATAAALRVLLAGLPVLAILFLPVLFDLGAVFPWPAGSSLAPASAQPLEGFARHWYTPGGFGVRAAVYLVLWVVLSLFFVRPAPPSPRHRATACIGLALHLVVGTLAAFDWWMSLDQGFLSSAYGLLVIAAQTAFALTVAALMVLAGARALPERAVLLALLAVLFVAGFLQFSQYLVVWSANLPKEIVWYQSRWVGVLGPAFVIGAPVLLALTFAALIPATLTQMRLPVAAALGAAVVLAVLDLACLASPRGSFTFGGVGTVLLFLVVVGGLGAVGAAVLGGRLLESWSPTVRRDQGFGHG